MTPPNFKLDRLLVLKLVAIAIIVLALGGCHRGPSGGPDLRIQIDHIVHEPDDLPDCGRVVIPPAGQIHSPPAAGVVANEPAQVAAADAPLFIPSSPTIVPSDFHVDAPAAEETKPAKASLLRRLIVVFVCLGMAVLVIYLHTLKVKGTLPDVVKLFHRYFPGKPPTKPSGPSGAGIVAPAAKAAAQPVAPGTAANPNPLAATG